MNNNNFIVADCLKKAIGLNKDVDFLSINFIIHNSKIVNVITHTERKSSFVCAERNKESFSEILEEAIEKASQLQSRIKYGSITISFHYKENKIKTFICEATAKDLISCPVQGGKDE